MIFKKFDRDLAVGLVVSTPVAISVTRSMVVVKSKNASSMCIRFSTFWRSYLRHLEIVNRSTVDVADVVLDRAALRTADIARLILAEDVRRVVHTRDLSEFKNTLLNQMLDEQVSDLDVSTFSA